MNALCVPARNHSAACNHFLFWYSRSPIFHRTCANTDQQPALRRNSASYGKTSHSRYLLQFIFGHRQDYSRSYITMYWYTIFYCWQTHMYNRFQYLSLPVNDPDPWRSGIVGRKGNDQQIRRSPRSLLITAVYISSRRSKRFH